MDYKKIFKNRELRLKLINCLRFIPAKPYLKLVYRIKAGKKLNLKNPVTFCDKQNWLKLNEIHPEYTQLVDKIGVREYIKEILGEDNYDIFIKSDLGDIVGINGIMMRTNTGQLTVKCQEFVHLSKAIKPLPDKFHGLQDVEEARRRRYVDLIVNEDSRKVAFMRPRIIRTIQRFFDNQGFVEVETPVLQPILGGAAARPFATHHNALDMPFYLRIATELPLKRLIVGGMEAVYEIGRVFRNEGMDPKHNPEFTLMEAYLAYSDLEGMMDLTEGIINTVAMKVRGTYDIEYKGHAFSLAPGFKRLRMTDAIKEQTGIDFNEHYTFEEAVEFAKQHDIEVEEHFGIEIPDRALMKLVTVGDLVNYIDENV